MNHGFEKIMPDLYHMVQFHSGQVRNFYLFVLGQVKINLQFHISYMVIIMNSNVVTTCVENSVDPDQLASEEAS